MRKHVFAIVLVMVVALMATFATTITSASATSTYDDIMSYDINDDGIVDRADFELIKNDIVHSVDKNRYSAYSIRDLVVLERSFRNQVTYVSKMKLSEENDWFIRNNLYTDQAPQLVENSSNKVVINCQFTQLVFNGLIDVYPLIANADIICTFYCANESSPFCVCRYKGAYCLTTVKILAPAIERLDASSLVVSKENNEFISNWLNKADVTTEISEEENTVIISHISDVISDMVFTYKSICDVYPEDPRFVCRYGTYLVWTDQSRYYISHEQYIGIAVCAYKIDVASEETDELMRDIFDEYELIDIDISKHTLYFENEYAGVYLFFEGNNTSFDYNASYEISSASLKNEPNFVITIISDGFSYRMTAVR